jgi:hypothetical protein
VVALVTVLFVLFAAGIALILLGLAEDWTDR